MNILKMIATGTFALLATAANASSFTQIAQASYELYRDGKPICSAQFIKPQELLTAAHCMKDSAQHKYSIQTIKDNVKFTYELTPFHIAPEYDTATLLVVDKTVNFPTVDLGITAPTLGDEVLLAGYPDVQGYFFGTLGVFSGEVPMPPAFGIEESASGKNQYVVSTWAIPGSSGAGLYKRVNDEYMLIGTMHGGPNDVMNFTSTVEGVRAVL